MKKYLMPLLTKTFIVMFGCLFLVSCNGANCRTKRIENVKELFPNSKIYKEVNNSFTYYIIDSTGLKKVELLNLDSPDISNIEMLVEVK